MLLSAGADEEDARDYLHVLIPSFEALQKYKEWTDDWCITLSDIAFDEYSEGGRKEIYPDGSVDSVTNRWNAIGEEAASEAWKLLVNCHNLVLPECPGDGLSGSLVRRQCRPHPRTH